MGYNEELIENEKLIGELKKKTQKLRRDVIVSMGVGVAGHIGGSSSSADIVATLYFYKMEHDPKNPKWKERDGFLLSKEHIGILWYTALTESGHFPVEGLKHTREIGSYLQRHPDVQKIPGVEAGTGSLEQGFSIGLGMALEQRLDHLDSRTYVLVRDGEIAEGQIWEVAVAANAFKADSLTAIVDKNRLRANGKTRERLDTGDIMAKFLGFGWHVVKINGHDIRETLGALDEAETIKGVPTAAITNTAKGKDVSFAENAVGYHDGMLTEETYRQALQKLAEQEQEA